MICRSTQTLILIARENLLAKVIPGDGSGGGGDDDAESSLMGRGRDMSKKMMRDTAQMFLNEAKLQKTTDTMAFVPMICIIMVFARLRANDMGLDPQVWGQAGMWASTIAILVQATVVLAFPSMEGGAAAAGGGGGDADSSGRPVSLNDDEPETMRNKNDQGFVFLLGKLRRGRRLCTSSAGSKSTPCPRCSLRGRGYILAPCTRSTTPS